MKYIIICKKIIKKLLKLQLVVVPAIIIPIIHNIAIIIKGIPLLGLYTKYARLAHNKYKGIAHKREPSQIYPDAD